MRTWEKWWENVPDDYMLAEVQWTHPIRSLMAEEAKIGDNVLDVACGQCISYPFFRKAGLEYVGLDLTRKFIESSREIYPGIELHEANALNMAFADASFDTVCCKDLLEHLTPEEVQPLIREMWRVTKRKMMIAFFIPPWDNPKFVLLIDGPYGPYYINWYNKHDIMAIFKDLEDLEEVDIKWVRTDAAIKIMPPQWVRTDKITPPPGEKRITHAPLYIITKKIS